ncbi:SpvB/TcaC N-terminal domain-containing protein [Sandaracinus amylolyticus]|uniref:Insecticide toxin TcdB middle/N-terminal domain-containing protein n=1 Tax=Sandaracinus amylolyticus TaxID=927083 RepID=A0A0F6SGZ7_9BACT|nr:SpvB/TcaC N-terminal domain-containing protein [Sandaracinus amylolyticus]AKF09564.1 Hypothetical protein DB32_006713 [Sandaracinus amylolyticus]
MLFWTPLAPRVAHAQQIEISEEEQRAIREAAYDRQPELDEAHLEDVELDREAEYEGPPPSETSSGAPLALPGGDTRTAVNPQAISLPTAEGSIDGMGESFTPNLSSGTGSIGVPIAVAPGRSGVQPSFSLAYATSGGNGPVGFGWSLSAPFISRQVDRGVPQYDDQQRWHRGEDRFIYNGGQELVPVDSTAMARVDMESASATATFPDGVNGEWQEYRARVEGGFMRFFRAPDFTRWVVLSKDGSRFDFGRVSAGPSEIVSGSVNALERDPSAPNRVYRWMLTRMADSHGSPVWYRYQQFDNNAYLQDVTYVSPHACAVGSADDNAGCSESLASYASRVAFEYEARLDVFDTWVSGWRIATPRRLARVVVTAWDDDLGERALVRRYHLSYSNAGFHSMLTAVQLEGRPDAANEWGVRVLGAPVSERSLSASPVGPMLPAMRFDYTSVPSALDGTVHDVIGSPPHSVDEARSDLFDVNSDGLPDLVVTDPARYRTRDGRPAAGVFFNGFRGTGAAPAQTAAQFSAAVPVAVPPGMDGVMALSNPNVAPMDIDGDGRSDLLHMPRQRTYGWFSPTRSPDHEGEYSPGAQGWQWSYEQIQLPTTDADPRIDLGRDGAHIQVLDVNNDHLIDVVRTTGTEIQTWLNLGWLDRGEGRFGSYSWRGETATLSTAPVRSCLPVAGTVYDFEDPESRLGDMNGDGLQDLVRIRRGRVIYWPGRGDGSFGIGTRGCAPGLTSDRHIEMTTPPAEINTELAGVYLADIDSDGTDDVVQVRFDAIDVWLNRAGRAFAQRIIVRGVPANPGFANRIRLVDIDGSGTVDVVYGTAHGWRYIDLVGGLRPRLLVGVENGLGARTELQYETSAVDYLRDLQACATGDTRNCFTWNQPGDPGERLLTHRSGGSPVISTVVRSITTTDRMDVYGLDPQRATQRLHYHDAYYEGIEQEFRGFGVTDSWAIGDWNNPTTITRTWFQQGRRSQAIAAERLEHNPDEALKGRECLTETLDDEGRYLASAHATLAVRHLADGLDGRPIDYAYVVEANEIRYDTTPFTPLTDARVTLTDVEYRESGTDGDVTSSRTREVPIRGARWARIRTTYDRVDNLGHVLEQTAHGAVEVDGGLSAVDSPIVSHAEVVRLGTWTWRTRRSWVDGPSGLRLGETTIDVDDFTAAGDPQHTVTTVTGVPTLEFGGESSDEGGALGYDIADARRNVSASVAYDAWGQPIAQCAGGDLGGVAATAPPAQCLRFGTVTRDARFAQLALVERAWVGRAPDAYLETAGVWDRGLALLLSAEAPNHEISAMRYDGFGRPVAAIPPAVAGCPDGLPTTLIRYELTSDPENAPLSRVRTTTVLRNAADCSPANPIEGIGYVDGLGRPRAALATGDETHAWVRSGITTFDQKGSVRRTYQSDFYDGSENDFAAVVALPADIPYAVTRYDAFGRARGVIAEDGSTVWTSHHALSTDVCDPLDNDHSSPHYRTCTTARVDGHGRVIDQILRNRDPDTGADEQYRLWTWYRQDGAVLALARTQRTASITRPASVPARDATTVARTFTYDSIGRRWTSADPDTDSRRSTRTAANRSWRYLFNRVGDLAAVRDPRGCGQNFFYDLGGRLVGEQYVSCTESSPMRGEQPIALLAAGATGLDENTPPVLVDVRYYYDDYSGLDWSDDVRSGDLGHPEYPEVLAAVDARAAGMPTGVEDRGQRSVIAYDRRGNAVWSARQMAFISNAPELLAAPLPHPDEEPAPNDVPRRIEAPSTGTIAYDAHPAHTYVRRRPSITPRDRSR